MSQKFSLPPDAAARMYMLDRTQKPSTESSDDHDQRGAHPQSQTRTAPHEQQPTSQPADS